MGYLCYTSAMANEIVKFSNQFNNQALRRFNAVHLDLLMAIASRVRDKGTSEVCFTFDDLRKLIHDKYNLTNVAFANKIIETNERLIMLHFMFRDGSKTIQFPLFTEFETDEAAATLKVAVNEKFAFLLNNLTSEFTRFELEQFAELKSSYAKECYRRLKQYRQTGVWKVSLADFRRLLDVPKSYGTAKLNERVLQPILDELYPLLHVQLKKIYQKNKAGRGRPALTALEFHFDKEFTPHQIQASQASLKALEKEKQARNQQEELEASQKRSQALYGALGGFNAAYLRSSLSEAGMSEEKVSELLKKANQEIESGDLGNTQEALQAWISREIHAWKAHLSS